MSDDHISRQPLGGVKARPLWRPLDSMRASMVKQVFSREQFTHKKGLLFTPTVHTEERSLEIAEHTSLDAPEPTPDDALHAPGSSPETPPASAVEAPDVEVIRAQAFAEGLAQGLEQAQQQAQQQQAVSDQEALAAQATARAQALLQEIDHKVEALIEEPSQLQEPLKRLALHLAEQLVLAELSLSPQAVANLIERCMDTLDASDTASVVVEMNPQDMAMLQSLQRAEGAPKPAWRLQADSALLPGSVRVRADDAVVSDLIENRLESLAQSLLKDPTSWKAQSAFAPSKLASRLAAQRGSAQTVEDAQTKAPAFAAPFEPHHETHAPLDAVAFDAADEVHEAAAETHDPTYEDGLDAEEKHTYEAHEVMKAAPAPPEAMTSNFHETLNDISLELDSHDD